MPRRSLLEGWSSHPLQRCPDPGLCQLLWVKVKGKSNRISRAKGSRASFTTCSPKIFHSVGCCFFGGVCSEGSPSCKSLQPDAAVLLEAAPSWQCPDTTQGCCLCGAMLLSPPWECCRGALHCPKPVKTPNLTPLRNCNPCLKKKKRKKKRESFSCMQMLLLLSEAFYFSLKCRDFKTAQSTFKCSNAPRQLEATRTWLLAVGCATLSTELIPLCPCLSSPFGNASKEHQTMRKMRLLPLGPWREGRCRGAGICGSGERCVLVLQPRGAQP